MSDRQEGKLKLLSPTYNEGEHGYYVELVEDALHAGALNIALSGAYGTGKSSILEQVSKINERKVARISFAPLAGGTDKLKREEAGATREEVAIESRTNRIQKEIIKQLFYSVSPEDLPLSRLHRIHVTSWQKRLIYSVIGGVICFGILLLSGAYSSIVGTLFPSSCGSWLVAICGYMFFPLFVLSALVLMVWMIQEKYAGHFTLEKIGAGGMAVTLTPEDGTHTYFDKYLDEIVYFFLNTDKRIVILEDLDRFETPEIFDSLRELNSIINLSLQSEVGETRKKVRKTQEKDDRDLNKVQFIYAIKDSVFPDQLIAGNEKSDLLRQVDGVPFARTKFFDVIIPVVPFISHENAKYLAAAYFDKDDSLVEVLDIAAEYIPDMRLLINISNEYKVYKKKLNRCNSLEKSGLDCAHLLGFLIYKNTYLEDASRLSEGNSKLDFIYNAKQTIVDQAITAIRNQINRANSADDEADGNKDLSRFEKDLNDVQSARIVDLISKDEYTSCLDDKGNADGGDARGNRSLRTFIDDSFGDNGLATALLRSDYLNEDYIQYSIVFGESLPASARNFIYHQVNLHKPSYNFQLTDSESKSVIKEVAKRGKRAFREPALMNCNLLDFLADTDDEVHSPLFNELITKLSELEDTSTDFLSVYLQSGKLTDKVLRCLAKQCPGIFHFLLHQTMSEDEMRKDLNIVLANLSPNINYTLGEDDRGRAKKLIEGIVNSEDGKPNAFSSFKGSSCKPLVAICEKAGVRVQTIAKLSDLLQIDFVAAGLYEYNRQNLTLPGRVPSLDEMRRNRGYEGNEENTTLKSDSLDKKIWYSFYADSLTHIKEYLSFMQKGDHSLSTATDDEVLSILEELSDADNLEEETLRNLFHWARPDIEVSDIWYFSVDDSMRIKPDWNKFVPALLKENRIKPSIMNVEAVTNSICKEDEFIIDEYGEAMEEEDEYGHRRPVKEKEIALKLFLEKQSFLTDVDQRPDEAREELAEELINLVNKNPNKLELIKSILPRDKFIDPTTIQLAVCGNGESYTDYLQSGIIPDSAESWEVIQSADWEKRINYISASKNFSTYMEDSLKPKDACKIIIDKQTTPAIREEIWNNPERYIFPAGPDLILETSHSVVETQELSPLSYSSLLSASDYFETPDQFSELITLSLPSLKVEEVLSLLRKVPVEGYERLVSTDKRVKIVRLPNTACNETIIKFFADKELVEIEKKTLKNIYAKRKSVRIATQIELLVEVENELSHRR